MRSWPSSVLSSPNCLVSSSLFLDHNWPALTLDVDFLHDGQQLPGKSSRISRSVGSMMRLGSKIRVRVLKRTRSSQAMKIWTQNAYHCERCRCRVKWAMGDGSFDSDGASGRWKGIASPAGARLTKSERCGCAKCQPGRKTLPRKVARAPPCGSSEHVAAIPKAVSLGFGLFELAHNRWLTHFKILSSSKSS
jgi:hypothetical protein